MLFGTYRPHTTQETEAFSDANSCFLDEQENENFNAVALDEEFDEEAQRLFGPVDLYGNAGGVTAYARVEDTSLAVQVLATA